MKKIDGKNEDEILKLLRSGNKSSFTWIYNHYWEKLYLAAYVRLNNPTGAEEVVQEVFFQLWNRRASLHIKNLSAYLAAMTRYAVYRYIANESKIKEQEKKWSLDYSESYDISHDVENTYLLNIIRDLANDLPEKCRLVFIYSKLEDKPLTEIASRMNISQKTAEAHLTKALRFIRLRLNNIISLLMLALLYF